MSVLPEPGDRIEVISMPQEPDPIETGKRGTVLNVVDTDGLARGSHQIWVDWDCGEDEVPRTLSLIVPPDQFRIVEEANT